MAKLKRDSEKVLVFRSGERRAITGENGKFWRCGGTQFRKGNPEIFGVEDAPKKPEVEIIPDEVAESPCEGDSCPVALD